MILYKTLTKGGASQYQGWKWPLPDDDGTPGDWVELDTRDRDVELCDWGLHGWLTIETARTHKPSAPLIYEMELDESQGTKSDFEKACGHRARLLRLLEDENGPVIRLADLIWQ